MTIIKNRPTCDICRKTEAIYDGKTVNGPWAYMCELCWQHQGVGRLGTGFGQKLVAHGDLS